MPTNPVQPDAVPTGLPAAVLWDMDGTLVDTEPRWMAAEIALMADSGRVWTAQDHAELIGMPLLAAARVLHERGADPAPEAIVTRLVASVAASLAEDVPWQPGVPELLAGLRAAGVPCAMVTMSYRELAEAVAGDAPEGTFAVLVPGEEVTHGKPHPEAYLRAAELLGVDIADCVALEDSPPGVASAYASGARTIGVQSIVRIEPRPGLSRVDSLTRIGMAEIMQVAAGRVIDLVDATVG